MDDSFGSAIIICAVVALCVLGTLFLMFAVTDSLYSPYNFCVAIGYDSGTSKDGEFYCGREESPTLYAVSEMQLCTP